MQIIQNNGPIVSQMNIARETVTTRPRQSKTVTEYFDGEECRGMWIGWALVDETSILGCDLQEKSNVWRDDKPTQTFKSKGALYLYLENLILRRPDVANYWRKSLVFRVFYRDNGTFCCRWLGERAGDFIDLLLME